MAEQANFKNNLLEEETLYLLYQMKLIRRFEEKAAEMYTKTEIRGFLHLYIGEEAVAVGVSQALNENDLVIATYREHGHALARNVPAKKIMAEMYGRKEGCSGGRGGSMHLFDKEKNFYGGNAIVAGHIPIAVGMALAVKKQKQNKIVCCFFGEGAMAEGEFHEAMNLAALWQVPVLFICENNLYAMGTAIRYTHASQELEKRGKDYGIESAAVDGMDVLKVCEAAMKAVENIRTTGKPYFLVCNTYRFRAHSMFDAELYRNKNEVEEWKHRDPILLLERHMLENELSDETTLSSIDAKIEKEIQEATDYAEAGTWEPVENLTQFLYSEKSTNG
ncbi:MAG: pyruvate dehydrogenase (acetyl-transferring) E1 component subunit alpha [Sphingobacteriales bacterium]|nr:pyruvate dehydrogenase (acetyl-transferring) E1 component subunit alpha [Sphingobacteriales bacterium]